MALENFKKESLDEVHKKEAINQVMQLNAGSAQKAELVLIILGIKPSTELSLFPWNSTQEEAERILLSTGLNFVKKDKPLWEKASVEYAISNNPELVQKLLQPTTSAEYGRLMGYPESAIEAFESEKTYEGILPEDIENSIFRLKFSQDHFNQEFEVVRKWNEAIRNYAPELLEQ